jgi:hypothetical protein
MLPLLQGFYRRSIRKFERSLEIPYKCEKDLNCQIEMERIMCSYCRYQRCLSAGIQCILIYIFVVITKNKRLPIPLILNVWCSFFLFTLHMHFRFIWYRCKSTKRLTVHLFITDYKIGMCCFSAKHAALMRKSKDWLPWNQDNVSEWCDMSIRRLLFSNLVIL